MADEPLICILPDRACVEITGGDWRGFLQGLITQDVLTLGDGELRFGALLTPQGRLAFDLFVLGGGGGCLIDCAADRRDALIQRLGLYRLRAKVAIEASERSVEALWRTASAPALWRPDPRLAALGFRGYGAAAPEGALRVDAEAYERHRLACGAPGSADFGAETTYAIEANFDLLGGVDFKKGCFIGQETTSRMKRRGAIKNRMVPIAFDGPAPDRGGELMAGNLRAGAALCGEDGRAIALLRLDRASLSPRQMADGRAWRPIWPDWMGDLSAPRS